MHLSHRFLAVTTNGYVQLVEVVNVNLHSHASLQTTHTHINHLFSYKTIISWDFYCREDGMCHLHINIVCHSSSWSQIIFLKVLDKQNIYRVMLLVVMDLSISWQNSSTFDACYKTTLWSLHGQSSTCLQDPSSLFLQPPHKKPISNKQHDNWTHPPTISNAHDDEFAAENCWEKQNR